MTDIKSSVDDRRDLEHMRELHNQDSRVIRSLQRQIVEDSLQIGRTWPN